MTPSPPPHEYFFASPTWFEAQLPGESATHWPPPSAHVIGAQA